VPKVSPFTGLLFDPERAGPLERVTAPPYDMITTDEERRFHAASPHNVVRLILGRVDGAGDHDDQYTKAPEFLRRWRDEGVLAETDGPSWFPYEMTFHFQGQARRVRGVVCAVEIEPWGGAIVPHERTLVAPVEDRLRLLRSVRANLSPVYGVVAGPVPALGPFLGSILITSLETYLRATFSGMKAGFGGIYLIIYGVVLILMVRWAPEGLTGIASPLRLRRTEATA
jgi:hypothetical protein